MDASFSLRRLTRHLAPVAAGLIGFGIALGIATAPAATLDAVVARLDLAVVFPAASPPVGVTGRSLLAIAVGGMVAALGWLGPLLRRVGLSQWRVARNNGVAVRRADLHPDAPPRPPFRARDMAVPPASSPPSPPPAVAPEVIPAMVAPAESATIALPVIRAAPAPEKPAEVVSPTTVADDDIARMLDRLERAARRPRRFATPPAPVAAPPVRLEDTLDQLRRLATR